MTNTRFSPEFFSGFAPAAAMTLALSILLTAGAQAQGLRPSAPLRFSDPITRPAQGTAQRQADFIVAVVNSEPITNSEVRLKVIRTEQQIAQQGAAMPPRSELVKQLLERMISDKAQLQMATASGIRIEENAIDAAVQTVASQNQVTVDELRSRLRADGVDYAQFRSEVRDELLVGRLRAREVDSKVVVTDQEIDQFLRDQGGASADASPVALNLAEILVAVPENATPEQVAALQARAQQVVDRARSGTDFTALAAEFSASPTRAAGGLMGLRSVDRYPQLFVDATQSLQAGGLAGPVRSGAGFHILKVIEKRQAGMPSALVTQTHSRHILLRLNARLTEAAAIEKLAEVKKRIQAGQADFAATAREISEDGSAKEGGDLGWVSPGVFVPEFETVMNGLAPNQVSDPVVSRFGVHLIQVLERRETQLSQKDQREIARNALREKKQNEAYALWAQDVRGRAYVEYREPPQ
ncbi:peptidylprolyl isomerase [Polaromonas sp. YR568]|uniref:peptidylprolyl isomerase n=1 Tax=Polaromonas sp. YR568 TaxID=1855301 RepID=UPI000B848BA7|nr:peptidylprolyl isomerase [Polaromonas sp. YR568]